MKGSLSLLWIPASGSTGQRRREAQAPILRRQLQRQRSPLGRSPQEGLENPPTQNSTPCLALCDVWLRDGASVLTGGGFLHKQTQLLSVSPSRHAGGCQGGPSRGRAKRGWRGQQGLGPLQEPAPEKTLLDGRVKETCR